METCGICTYITHEFAVFLEAKPSEKTGKRVGYQSAYTSRFHGVTGLYYTTHVHMHYEKCGNTGHVTTLLDHSSHVTKYSISGCISRGARGATQYPAPA